MAKMFKLILEGKRTEITLGMPYGNVTLPQGFETPESDMTKIWKDYFFEIPADPIVEDLVAKWQPVIENTNPHKEAVEILKSEEQPVKRKPGRPFGTTKQNIFKKG